MLGGSCLFPWLEPPGCRSHLSWSCVRLRPHKSVHRERKVLLPGHASAEPGASSPVHAWSWVLGWCEPAHTSIHRLQPGCSPQGRAAHPLHTPGDTAALRTLSCSSFSSTAASSAGLGWLQQVRNHTSETFCVPFSGFWLRLWWQGVLGSSGVASLP